MMYLLYITWSIITVPWLWTGRWDRGVPPGECHEEWACQQTGGGLVYRDLCQDVHLWCKGLGKGKNYDLGFVYLQLFFQLTSKAYKCRLQNKCWIKNCILSSFIELIYIFFNDYSTSIWIKICVPIRMIMTIIMMVWYCYFRYNLAMQGHVQMQKLKQHQQKTRLWLMLKPMSPKVLMNWAH